MSSSSEAAGDVPGSIVPDESSTTASSSEGKLDVATNEKELAREAERFDAFNSILWMVYDGSDTFWNMSQILSVTPYAMLLGTYYRGLTYGRTFTYIAIYAAVSNFFIAISAPFLGAISDLLDKRKHAVLACAATYVIFMVLLPVYMDLFWALACWLVCNLAYQLGRNFYDSQIPYVTTASTRHVTQAIGGGLSFFGALLGVGLCILTKIFWGPWTAISSNRPVPQDLNFGGIRQFFWLAMGLFCVIVIPYLFHNEKSLEASKRPNVVKCLKESGINTVKTLKEIVSQRNSLLFTIGWYLMSDAAGAGQSFTPLLLQGAAGMTSSETDYVTLVGIPASIISGLLVGIPLKYLGARVCLILTAIIDMIGEVFFILAIYRVGGSKWSAYLAAVFAGFALGFLWIVGRQFIIELSPPSKLASWGGFQRISGRVGSIFSPLIFSGIVDGLSNKIGLQGSYLIAVLYRMGLYTLGIIIVFFIVDPHWRYLAGERAPYPGLYKRGGWRPRKKKTKEDDDVVAMSSGTSGDEMVAHTEEPPVSLSPSVEASSGGDEAAQEDV
eukprot:TRINITY_DN1329_c0_g2_i1.p1 TRINITY_DN1329_c0_g2~~TRINITY_DN1329_c0_g2_i1.p1  ORF type:complete len:575 (-),score=137.91 TRINITY_DN1329_c0_g2_i1:127-1791(-)